MHIFPARLPRDHSSLRSRAFTLLEVLLVMAIIALMAAVLIGGSAEILNDKPVAVSDVFWKAVQEARKLALTKEREVQLRFVDDRDRGKMFVVVDGESKREFPLPAQAVTNDLRVDFLSNQKGGNLIMIGGVVVETQPLPYATFYADGTCQGFRLQVMRNGSAGIIGIDPWTCAPVLTPPDPNAPKPS